MSYQDADRIATRRKQNAGSIALSALLLTFAATAGMSSQSAFAAFPSENGKIAFTNSDEIHVMNHDGSEQTNITNTATSEDDPDWSPDSNKMAFATDRDGNGEIYVMNADGSGQTNLTNNATQEGYPDWSPDGSKIAFARMSDEGHYDIYIMNSDGAMAARLTHTPFSDSEPVWSPDGSKIAFVSNRDGPFEIYVMNADGTGATRLTHSPYPQDNLGWSREPDWSPDGSKITFNYKGSVWVMNVDGADRVQLTATGEGGGSPKWSPDGSKIAYTNFDEIIVMNADGTGRNVIASNLVESFEIDWGAAADNENTFDLTIQSVNLDGESLNGLWTVIRSTDGTVQKTGYTPLMFTGDAGTYIVSVSNYDGKVFSKWEDNSTDRTRTVVLSADTTITATYDTGNALRGFTSLTYTGTEEQPDLTVNAMSLDGNKILHMWTIIDPQSSDADSATYRVYATNGYQNLTFDHWEDGTANRVRTLSIAEAATITAYYKTE